MAMTPELQRQPIRELPTSVINKIAAGEVIERPASVVKELLENSVDSGASSIELSIENGGIDLIRICDNGCGIPREELQLAVTSHATSKITDADELFRVGTFGFRGEALASIAEISQFIIRSRTVDSDCGYELIVNGGHSEPINACGVPQGTTMEVRNLFYNTPVRRKFLKTAQTERGHVAEAFTRIALANPEIHLKFLHNGKIQQDLPPTDNWRSRIGDFFGPEISDNLIRVESEIEDTRIDGFVVDPSVSRANNRMQYLFLNGRYIRDRSLQHALSEAYRGLLMTGRYPITFLRLDMPPQMVDVNVHPAKLEVRFLDSGKLYSQLLGVIRNRFLTTDLTARAELSLERRSLENRTGSDQTATQTMGSSRNEFQLGRDQTNSQERLDFHHDVPKRDWTTQPQPAVATPSISSATPDFRPYPQLSSHSNLEAGSYPPEDLAEATPTGMAPRALQVHNTYLISETEEGMVVIDQHALHERIIYEQLREKVLAGRLESQKLLVPEPVPLPPAEAAAVLDHSDLLDQLGLVVEPFGGDTVLVSSYPAMLANHNPAEMLKGIIELLLDDGRQIDQRDLVDELLHMISCKAAIKAGDKLTPEEINDLIEHRNYCQDAHHCPHGRPTALVFSREELDKRFKRV